MPPKRTRNTWPSKHYNIGYIYNRNGVAYINIANKVIRSTKMAFKQANKAILQEFLEQEVYNYLLPSLSSRRGENHSVESLYEEFMAVRGHQSDSNERRLKYAFKHFMTENFDIIQTDNIRAHINAKIQSTTLSPNNSRKILQSLKTFFQYAVDEGYIIRNPVINSMIPSGEKSDLLVFTRAEVDKLIEFFEKSNPEMALLIEFVAITGTRITETINVRWDDINDTRILIHGKGNKDRIFPLEPFPELKFLLKKMEPFDNGEKLFKWISQASLQRQLSKACQKLGIYESNKNFHSIRKMRENELIILYGLDLNITAELMGHSRQVQEKHYLEKMQESVLTKKILDQLSKI